MRGLDMINHQGNFHLTTLYPIPEASKSIPTIKMDCRTWFTIPVSFASMWKNPYVKSTPKYTPIAIIPMTIASSDADLLAIIRSISYYSINSLKGDDKGENLIQQDSINPKINGGLTNTIS